MVKESTSNAVDSGLNPGGGNGNPLQYTRLEKSHGQRSLAECSPWGHEELAMNEGLRRHVCLEETHWVLVFFFFAVIKNNHRVN